MAEKDLVLVIRSSDIENTETDLMRHYGYVGTSMEKSDGEESNERLFTFYNVTPFEITSIRAWVSSRFICTSIPPSYTPLDGADILIEERKTATLDWHI